MAPNRRLVMGLGLIVAIFLFIQISAVTLVNPLFEAGHQPVDNPQDPTNPIFYIAIILVVTGLMLLAFRYDVGGVLRLAIVGSGAWISTYVLDVWLPATVSIGGLNALAIVAAAGLGIAMYVHPEWYVLDAGGALMGAAAAGLFGITFDVFPALVLLTVLALYDAISVYRTEHMLTLASGVMDLKVPVVLVIPMTAGYSFQDATLPDPEEDEDTGALKEATPEDVAAEAEESEPNQDGRWESADEQRSAALEETEDSSEGPLERDALFIGLGDAIIPTILVASATFFAPSDIALVAGVPLPAVTAMVGTFLGLAVLLRMVIAGRAHAGLPLLNGGAIAGYLGGALYAGMGLIEALGLAPYF